MMQQYAGEVMLRAGRERRIRMPLSNWIAGDTFRISL
jgi:hypothetical protein